MRQSVRCILGFGVLALAACTSVPKQLEGDFADVSPARVEPAMFGQPVRWGGVIVDARNEPHRTCFEILSRSLGTSLRPRSEDFTAGRFIACKDGFFDPEVYAKGREMTVTGRLDRIEQRRIEEFDYRYPVVEVDELVLWQEPKERLVHYDHYDPFWYPYFWGRPYWGYFPYYRYPYHFGSHVYIRRTLPGPSHFKSDHD